MAANRRQQERGRVDSAGAHQEPNTDHSGRATALNTPRKNIQDIGSIRSTSADTSDENSHQEPAKLGYIMYLLACLNYPRYVASKTCPWPSNP